MPLIGPLENLLAGKPTAIMGASPSIFGTTRGQLHLRQILHAANANVVRRPEIAIRRAQTVIDEHGNLNDDYASKKIRSLLGALTDEIETAK